MRQIWKISRVAMSRGTRFPYAGYFSSRKYQRSDSGIDFGARLSPRARGTQTRPPSPRADSDMSRSLSEPGMDVGWTWMNSPLAYRAPSWYAAAAAVPVLMTEFVERPKTIPGPPVDSS